jgi:hypothetical protein
MRIRLERAALARAPFAAPFARTSRAGAAECFFSGLNAGRVVSFDSAGIYVNDQ